MEFNIKQLSAYLLMVGMLLPVPGVLGMQNGKTSEQREKEEIAVREQQKQDEIFMRDWVDEFENARNKNDIESMKTYRSNLSQYLPLKTTQVQEKRIIFSDYMQQEIDGFGTLSVPTDTQRKQMLELFPRHKRYFAENYSVKGVRERFVAITQASPEKQQIQQLEDLMGSMNYADDPNDLKTEIREYKNKLEVRFKTLANQQEARDKEIKERLDEDSGFGTGLNPQQRRQVDSKRRTARNENQDDDGIYARLHVEYTEQQPKSRWISWLPAGIISITAAIIGYLWWNKSSATNK